VVRLVLEHLDARGLQRAQGVVELLGRHLRGDERRTDLLGGDGAAGAGALHEHRERGLERGGGT
jgi:hypothetical protein